MGTGGGGLWPCKFSGGGGCGGDGMGWGRGRGGSGPAPTGTYTDAGVSPSTFPPNAFGLAVFSNRSRRDLSENAPGESQDTCRVRDMKKIRQRDRSVFGGRTIALKPAKGLNAKGGRPPCPTHCVTPAAPAAAEFVSPEAPAPRAQPIASHPQPPPPPLNL